MESRLKLPLVQTGTPAAEVFEHALRGVVEPRIWQASAALMAGTGFGARSGGHEEEFVRAVPDVAQRVSFGFHASDASARRLHRHMAIANCQTARTRRRLAT